MGRPLLKAEYWHARGNYLRLLNVCSYDKLPLLCICSPTKIFQLMISQTAVTWPIVELLRHFALDPKKSKRPSLKLLLGPRRLGALPGRRPSILDHYSMTMTNTEWKGMLQNVCLTNRCCSNNDNG